MTRRIKLTPAGPSALCSWPIKGDLNKLCVRAVGHNGGHRDVAYYESRRERNKDYRKAHMGRLKEYYRDWRTANSAYISEYYREYLKTPKGREVVRRKSTKRHALKKNAVTGPLPNDLINYLGNLYGWECQGCYCELKRSSLTIDHVIPLNSVLPMHLLFNLQPMCLSCNCSKGDSLHQLGDVELALLRKMAVER